MAKKTTQEASDKDTSQKTGVSPAKAPVGEGKAALAPAGVQVTFMGNTYDLMSVVAVVTGGLVLVSCLTCNVGFYCLPLVPIVLGLVGLLSAHQSVDEKRTRLFSWLGIASGGLLLLLLLVVVALYVGFIVFMIALGEFD